METNNQNLHGEEEVKNGYFNYYFDEVCKKHLFDFKGKLGRKDYWMGVLFLMFMQFLFTVIMFMGNQFAPGFHSLASIIAGICYLVLCITSMGLAVRRLHDTGRSGWWILFGTIPLVGPIVVLYMLCQPGETPSPRVKWSANDWATIGLVIFCIILYTYLFENML